MVLLIIIKCISENLKNLFNSEIFFRGEDLVSEATAEKDQPLFCLKKDGVSFDCSVMTLDFCEQVLRAAGDKKMHEVRACLEGKLHLR